MEAPREPGSEDMSVEDIAQVDQQMANHLQMKQEIELQIEQLKLSGAGENSPALKPLDRHAQDPQPAHRGPRHWFREKYKGYRFNAPGPDGAPAGPSTSKTCATRSCGSRRRSKSRPARPRPTARSARRSRRPARRSMRSGSARRRRSSRSSGSTSRSQPRPGRSRAGRRPAQRPRWTTARKLALVGVRRRRRDPDRAAAADRPARHPLPLQRRGRQHRDARHHPARHPAEPARPPQRPGAGRHRGPLRAPDPHDAADQRRRRDGGERRVFAVTSASPGDGKTQPHAGAGPVVRRLRHPHAADRLRPRRRGPVDAA